MSGHQTPTHVKVAAAASVVSSALSALGWLLYSVAFITGVAIHFPFSLGESIVLSILSAVSPFALIVYIRYSLIMAGCWLDNISMVPRTAIVIFFALCHSALTVAVLVELGVRVPCLSQHRGAVCDLSQMEKMPHGVCMFAGSLWMLLCSAICVCFATVTAVLSMYHRRRRSQYAMIQ